ncbi:MAG: HlyD family secretion protein [Oscillospiraceae bacterium]|nr:HlyD family secretion protein [Oscillospiraceae bacterium]
MDGSGNKDNPGGRRRGAWAIGGTFAALLAALMFFSGTIYQYNLPKVSASRPSNGYLSKRETSSGYADWESIGKQYSPIAGKVSEICISEGDRVDVGQVLFLLSFDRAEAERRLREIDNSLEKLEIDIQGLYLRMERANRAIADGNASKAEARRLYEAAAGKVATTSNDLAILEIDIKKAEQTLADATILFEAGAGTEREIASAQDNLDTLYLRHEATIRSMDEQLEKDAESLDTLYRNISSYDKSIADSLADIEQLELDLKSRERDKISYDLQREPYLEALAGYDAHGEIRASVGGLVLSVDAEVGQNVGEGAMMATIGIGNSYIVECQISIENNFVFLGDSCELSNTAHVFEGVIISIAPGDRGKALKVRLASDEVTVGETFNLTFERISDVRYTLVPNGALNQDNDGYYLNQVKRRDGLLGSEFYLERLDIYIGDSDSQNTVITSGLRFFEPIVLTSDKPVQPGETIMLINEADFFAD